MKTFRKLSQQSSELIMSCAKVQSLFANTISSAKTPSNIRKLIPCKLREASFVIFSNLEARLVAILKTIFCRELYILLFIILDNCMLFIIMLNIIYYIIYTYILFNILNNCIPGNYYNREFIFFKCNIHIYILILEGKHLHNSILKILFIREIYSIR